MERPDHWGNHLVRGGQLALDGNAWSPDVVWGDVTTRPGQNIVWGVICASAGCDANGDARTPWGTSCSDAQCSSVVWNSPYSTNVVWGSRCGGADCRDATVWGTSESDTVVWGTNDSDTVVWGTNCQDSCQPMI